MELVVFVARSPLGIQLLASLISLGVSRGIRSAERGLRRGSRRGRNEGLSLLAITKVSKRCLLDWRSLAAAAAATHACYQKNKGNTDSRGN
jgi:hypothetical protein